MLPMAAVTPWPSGALGTSREGLVEQCNTFFSTIDRPEGYPNSSKRKSEEEGII
jgi:hypothetical protein